MKKKLGLSSIATISFLLFFGCTNSENINTVNPNDNVNNNSQIRPNDQGPRQSFFPEELNLTTEQQNQIQQLQVNDSSSLESQTEIIDLIKESFKSDTFSKDDVEAKISSYKEDQFKVQAENIIAIYNVLNDEQKSTLTTNQLNLFRFNSREGSFFRYSPDIINQINTNLTINETQKAEIETLFSDITPEQPVAPQDPNEVTEVQTKVNSLLASDELRSVENLSQILKDSILTVDNGVEKINTLHGILDSEQRNLFLENIGFEIGAGGQPPNGPGGAGGQPPNGPGGAGGQPPRQV